MLRFEVRGEKGRLSGCASVMWRSGLLNLCGCLSNALDSGE